MTLHADPEISAKRLVRKISTVNNSPVDIAEINHQQTLFLVLYNINVVI
jgi:hypothetical protein